MREQRLHRELAAAGALQDVSRREPAPVTVNPVAQPLADGGQVALLNALAEIAEVAAGSVPELPRDDVPEAVSGEVAERSARPVHVLQDTVGVVRDFEAQILAVTRVPGLRQVGELQPSLEQLELQLESDQDVEVVGHLVRLDPDQRALDAVCPAIELLRVGLVEVVREPLLERRQQPLEIGPAASHPVLPEPALRLMEPERSGLRQRRPPELPVDPGLVQPVTSLVHGTE